MSSSLKHLLLSLTLLALFEAKASVTLLITDQHSQPLENALIEIELKQKNARKQADKNLYVMDQINKTFKPHILAIPQHALVNFPNSDDIRHHVYSFSKVKPFELKLYAGKPKSPISFEQLGVAVLGCNIHDSMVGYIYIHDNNLIYQSDSSGIINLEAPINSIANAWLWHPRNSKGVNQKEIIDVNTLTQNDSPVIKLTIMPPETRESFEDVFKSAQ
ncbi:methylamine utilization protein [Pseudoalteromonas sp. G4]|uniref:methylamine utilization protein n=1 Tax=Pseudoalteromonas sp. G4 TaxID=2992761 RepID=UPI00237D44EB|nr:methylamine utilization protein [Pseudoalteromonas sp. G4]MDE3271519.1 methylamine utilization protein [Pseudoalteromonas sp. G4]